MEVNWFGSAKIKKLMLAATIAALPSSTIAADDELAGTYRLISSTRTILETGEVLDTWGKNPNGFIIYGKDGRMLVLIVRRDRPKPESVDKITDQQRADLHRSMTAYGGTYKFDGKRVEHKHRYLLERGIHRHDAGPGNNERRRPADVYIAARTFLR
jgi:hypothetical protein